MKREDFEALVRRYEEKAEENPEGFKRSVGFFAALGYIYFGFLLLIALALTVLLCGLVYHFFTSGGGKGGYGLVKLAAIVVGADYYLVRALWVRFPPPEGMRLKREDMPLLFDDTEEIRSRLQCPPVHEVVLTDEFNAAMAQVPRLGVFGWYKNTLIIGLPFLHAMSRESVRAVIAHELGHLSGLHGQFSGRIYRISEMWERLAAESEGSTMNALVRNFVKWYAPRLQARAFALRRANEYEADAASVLIAGEEETARLLVGIHARGPAFSRESNRRLENMAREGGATPPGFATAACLIAKEPLDAEDAERALDLMVLEETDYFDTHPCLLDRLESIGYKAAPADARALFEEKGLWPIRVERFAADDYLPNGDAELVHRLDESMKRKEVIENWGAYQEQLVETRASLAKLDAKMVEAPLSDEETAERAIMLRTTHGESAVIEWLESEVPKFPEHAGMRYMLGHFLLAEDREEAIEMLEVLLRESEEYREPCCHSLYNFYKRTGRHAEARETLRRLDSHGEEMEKAEAERRTFSSKDVFFTHDLPQYDFERVMAALETETTVVQAWILRKELEHLAEIKTHFLVLKLKHKGLVLDSEAANAKAVAHFLEECGALKTGLKVYVADTAPAPLRAATKKVPGALIYERKKGKK